MHGAPDTDATGSDSFIPYTDSRGDASSLGMEFKFLLPSVSYLESVAPQLDDGGGESVLECSPLWAQGSFQQ